MKCSKSFGVGCVVLLLAWGSAIAGDHEEGKHSKEDQGSYESHKERPDSRRDFGINDSEREIIHRHFADQEGHGKKGKDLPPGLAKKEARGGKLPPGWEKRMVKGETVPPEVYQQCQPLPRELQIKLPAPPVGTITVTVGGKVARLAEATHEILDVFDVLPKPPLPRP
jgi:hypothetical protein